MISLFDYTHRVYIAFMDMVTIVGAFDDTYVFVGTSHERNRQLILGVECHEGVNGQITLESKPVLVEGGEFGRRSHVLTVFEQL